MYESELFRYIFGVIDSGNQTIINPDMVDGRHSFAGIAHHQNGRRQDNIGVTDFKTVYRDISSGIVLADIQQACFATATSSGHDWLFDIHIPNNKIVDFRNIIHFRFNDEATFTYIERRAISGISQECNAFRQFDVTGATFGKSVCRQIIINPIFQLKDQT